MSTYTLSRQKIVMFILLLLIVTFFVPMLINSEDKKLEEDELGAIICGKGQEIRGQIHIAEPVAKRNNLWTVPIMKGNLIPGAPPDRLTRYVRDKTEIDCKIIKDKSNMETWAVKVPLASEQLLSLPFLLLYGKNKVVLNQKEVNNLKKYLVNSGGFLFVDEVDSVMEGGEFLTSIKEVLKQMLPEYPIKIIPKEHDIYHNVYELTESPRGHAQTSSDLEGVFIDGRLAAILSNRSYSTLWANTFSSTEYIPEVFQFSLNVIVYAVTHGKIADYSGYTKGKLSNEVKGVVK